jgi:hypothetical protein
MKELEAPTIQHKKMNILLFILSYTLSCMQSIGVALDHRREYHSEVIFLMKSDLTTMKIKIGASQRKRTAKPQADIDRAATPVTIPLPDDTTRICMESKSTKIIAVQQASKQAAKKARDAYIAFTCIIRKNARSQIEADNVNANNSLNPLKEPLFNAMQKANQMATKKFEFDLHGYRQKDVVDAIKERLNHDKLTTASNSPRLEIITGAGRHGKAIGIPPIKKATMDYFNREEVKKVYKIKITRRNGLVNPGRFTITKRKTIVNIL